MVLLPQPNSDVFTKVQEVLVRILGVDIDEVTPDAKLVEHLDMASINLLDIVLNLEKEFWIEIPWAASFFPDDILTNPDFVQEGKVNEAGMEVLRKRMSFVDFSAFAEAPFVREFQNLLTVGDLCRYIQLRRSQ